MGKNRKAAKQVSSSHVANSSDDPLVAPPCDEFLTSDDFQVVQKKRHHSGKWQHLPRSRSDSERIANGEDSSQGCHSGFWGVKSQPNLDSSGNLKGKEDSSNEKYISNGLDGGVDSGLGESSSIETSPDVIGLGLLSNDHGDCNSSVEKLSSEMSEFHIVPNSHLANGNLIENEVLNGTESVLAEVEKEAGVSSGLHQAKITNQKKKDKKLRNKQNKKKHETVSSRNRSESQMMVSSSSSDFSEMISPNVIDDTKKETTGERKRPSKKQLAAIHEALRKAKEDEEKRKLEETSNKKMAEEAEKLEQERQRLEQEKKDRKKLKEKQKREKMRAEGKLLTKSQKQSRARMEATLEALRQQGVDVPQIGEKKPRGPRLGNYKQPNRRRLDSSQSIDSGVGKSERHKSVSLSSQESTGKESLSDFPSSFESKDSWEMIPALESEGHFSGSEESDAQGEEINIESSVSVKRKNSANSAKLKGVDLKSATSEKEEIRLRSPVICVLGHVDTGKTKLLDYIRRTHIQDSEAGGITQQIGATMIPKEALREKCKMVKDFTSFDVKVPGLLVIDTPGHESFRNLRSRGSSICDIAILVVDIMHGLEPQTLESINLLKTDKIPFVVALNKIDRLFGWKGSKDEDIEASLAKQSLTTLAEFQKRCQDVVLQFANQCLNVALYYENQDPRSFVSMVPVSAITGDGMGNLLNLVTQLTQSMLHKKLVFSNELQATVLEVKAIPGLGTTIDVILVNGRLHEGDTIVLASQEGPFVTQIRSLLMPHPLKELRVKNPYVEYKTVEGSQGLKITGKDLDKTLAGLPLLVPDAANKLEDLKSKMSVHLSQSISYVKTSERGVHVQASTLGSLEALLEFLGSNGVSYVSVKVGPVVKKDVMKASIMLEHDVQYAAILAFDVKVERDAQELADSLGVKIFHANIIYHLVDQYTEFRDEMQLKRCQASEHFIFPCILKVLGVNPNTDLVRVHVEAGAIYAGTPLCVPTKGKLKVGFAMAPGYLIEPQPGDPPLAREGEELTIELEGGTHPLDGFGEDDYMVSLITKQSVEVCKEFYRDEFQAEDWQLVNALKKMLQIHG